MSAHQKWPVPGDAARKFQNEIDALMAATREAVLFHIPQHSELFAQIAAHGHQSNRIPEGMAGNGDCFEVLSAGW